MKMSRATVEQISKLPHKNRKSSENCGVKRFQKEYHVHHCKRGQNVGGGFYHQPNIMKNNESNQA